MSRIFLGENIKTSVNKNKSIQKTLNLKQILMFNKKEMIINDFQIKNMKVKSILLKNEKKMKNDVIVIDNGNTYFSKIKKKILYNNIILDFSVQIELIPFGKSEFDDENILVENEKKENELTEKKRFFDKSGNIVFLLNGKNKNKNKNKNKIKIKK